MRRASVFLHLSVLHEVRREIRVLRDVTLSLLLHANDLSPRTRIARLGTKEIRVSLRRCPRMSRSRFPDSSDSPGDDGRISGTRTRRVRSRTFTLIQPRSGNRLDRTCERRPQLWTLRRYEWGARTLSPPSVSLALTDDARALCLPPPSSISPVWEARRKSRRRGPPRLETLLTRWHERSRDARPSGQVRSGQASMTRSYLRFNQTLSNEI